MIRYASFGQRAWALVLDAVVDLLVLGLLATVVDGGALLGPFAAWYVLHHVGLVTEGGALGHRLVGLRVVSVDGERVPVGRAAARELARVALSAPLLGMGFLWMLDEPDRRCWHDVLAGTVVVRELDVAATRAPSWADSAPWRRPAADG